MLAAADDQFAQKLVMMDNASKLGIVDSMRLRQELAFLRGVKIAKVPFDKKDGGALSASQVQRWCQTQGVES